MTGEQIAMRAVSVPLIVYVQTLPIAVAVQSAMKHSKPLLRPLVAGTAVSGVIHAFYDVSALEGWGDRIGWLWGFLGLVLAIMAIVWSRRRNAHAEQGAS